MWESRVNRCLGLFMAATVLLVGPAMADEQLSIATAGTGGVYYPLGGGLAEIINENVDGYAATAEVTGGSVENMGLIAMGDRNIAHARSGFVHPGAVCRKWRRKRAWPRRDVGTGQICARK